MTEPGRHVAENRHYWDSRAPQWVAAGERAWAAPEPVWGSWERGDDEVSLLPERMDAMHAIELGCGTGYVSGWMARRGATVTAIDNSQRQLETARRLAAEHDTEIDFILGNAEEVPRPDGSFDFAISEYGAAIWCDPYRWIPEAHRLLRPGGRLVFLGSHPLSLICTPLDGDSVAATLARPYLGMYEFDWTAVEIEPGGIEFALTVGAWIDLFSEVGFGVDRYVELGAGPDHEPDAEVFGVPARWAHRWPSEHVWMLTRR